MSLFRPKKCVLCTVSAPMQAQARQLLTANGLRYSMRVRDRNGRTPGDVYEYSVYVPAKSYAAAAAVLNAAPQAGQAPTERSAEAPTAETMAQQPEEPAQAEQPEPNC